MIKKKYNASLERLKVLLAPLSHNFLGITVDIGVLMYSAFFCYT